MSDSHEDIARKFKAFLDQQDPPSAPGGSATRERLAQEVFWATMRDVLAINKGSSGLDILDNIAEAVLNGADDATQALNGTVSILPDPSRQETATEAAPHPIFSSKAKKRVSTGLAASTGKAKKKPRPSIEDLHCLDFELRADTPRDVVYDIKGLYRHARAVGFEPYQRAFPWENRHLFYDPEAYPDVYVAHWRFWQWFQKAFFDWALHVPLIDKNALGPRRKKKLNAVRERLRFISLCIETWGYYCFLRRLEAPGNSELMWWGGPSSKPPPKGEARTCPPVLSLKYQFKKDKPAYHQRIHDAIKPFRIDSPRFESLTEMLVQTGALVPTAKGSQRLSDKALARVVIDITSPKYVPDHWAPTLTDGVWRVLLADKRIGDLRVKYEMQISNGKFEPKKVPKYIPKEAKHEGFSPLFRADGKPTALGQATIVDDSDPKFPEGPDEALARMVAEAESKSDANKGDELEYITHGDEEEEDESDDDEEDGDTDEVED